MSKYSILRCFGAGVILYILMQICSLLPYISSGDGYLTIEFAILIIFSGTVMVRIVFYKNTSIIVGLVRTIITWSIIVCLFILGAYSGLVISIHNLIGLSASSSGDNVSGMLILTFAVVLSAISIFSLISLAVVRLINHLRKQNLA